MSGTKEDEPKRTLFSALSKSNTTGKRVGLSTEVQALLLGAVSFLPFTHSPARRFGTLTRGLRIVQRLGFKRAQVEQGIKADA